MIKATEALEKTKANIKVDNETRMATIQKFLDEECDTAIHDAIEHRQFCTYVQIPSSLANYYSVIANLLLDNGYQTKATLGTEPHILIMWK